MALTGILICCILSVNMEISVENLSEQEILQNLTHLQQGGYPLQSLWICFLVVNVTHKEKTKLLPEVCQKPLKDILAVIRVTFTV